MNFLKILLKSCFVLFKRFRLLFTAFGVACLMYGLVVAFILPARVIEIARETTQAKIGRRLEIDRLSINPFTLNAALQGVRLFEADEKNIAFSIAQANLNVSLASLIHLSPVLDQVLISEPKVSLVSLSAGQFNFSDVLDRILAMPPSESPALFSINNIQVQKGEVLFDDKLEKKLTRVTDISLGVPFVSNFPSKVKIAVQPSFSALVDGSRVSISGDTKPFTTTFDSTLHVGIERFNLVGLNDYIPSQLKLWFEQGWLTTDLQIQFKQPEPNKQALVVEGGIQIDQLSVLDKTTQRLLGLTQLNIRASKAELIKRQITLGSIEIDRPLLAVRRDSAGVINWLGVLPLAESEDKHGQRSTQEAQAPNPWRISLAQLKLSNGQIVLSDKSSSAPFSSDFDTELNNINLTVSRFDTDELKPSSIQLEFSTPEGEAFKIESQLVLKPFSTQGRVTISELQLKRYMPYIKLFSSAVIEDGQFNLSAKYDIAAAQGEQAAKTVVEDVHVALNKLRVTQSSSLSQKKLPVIELDSFSMQSGKFDIENHQFDFGQLNVDQLGLDIVRTKQGVNLLALASPTATKGDAAGTSVSPLTTDANAAIAPKISFSSLQVQKSHIKLLDQTPSEPVQVSTDALNLSVKGFNTESKQPFPVELAFSVKKAGQVKSSGQVGLNPLNVNATTSFASLPFVFAQGYLGDALNIRLTKAALSGKLNTRLQQAVAKPSPADVFPYTLAVSGALDVNNFASVDKVQEADFLRWKALNLKGIDIQLAPQKPPSYKVSEIALSDFYARVIVSAKGRVNLQDILAQPGAAQTDATNTTFSSSPDSDKQPAEAATTPASTISAVADSQAASSSDPASKAPTNNTANQAQIQLGKITLVNGNVNFSDNFIKPNYTANLSKLTGTVSKFSSLDTSPAELLIKGSIDDDGILDISGKVNPLARPLFLDIQAKASDLELTRLTPYAEKYAGYQIEKGKLSTTVKYHIENGQLSAENNVFLDQLTFGEKVDSPTATKLPVLLAVALLKNSRGEIDINLPVSGSISDPQFSIGGIVFKLILNLLAKAVTSPFSLLASAFGEAGQELAYIEFAPGSAQLSEASRAKLASLVKALEARPALKLEVLGRVDPELDVDGLRQQAMLKKMKALKLKALNKDGAEGSLDEMKIEPSERAKWIERVYDAEKFSKPRNAIGLAKKLPVDDMEKLILTNISVSEEDLRDLALQRASDVRAVIESSTKVAPDRLFLLAPRLTAEGIKDKGKTTRTDFILK